MPTIKKSTLTPTEALALANRNKSKLSPKKRWEEIRRFRNRTSRHKVRKFHFGAIIDGENIFLFDGLGAQYGIFSNDLNGKRECRVFALYEIFLQTPEENRQGGYKIDFCQID